MQKTLLRRSIVICLACFALHVNLEAQIAVELEGMNVLIAGFENPLTAVVSDVPDSCLSLQSDVGKISSYGHGKFGWSQIPDTNSVTLFVVDTCKNEVLAERRYRVRLIHVTITLGMRYLGGPMSADEFKKFPGLIAVTGDDVCCTVPILGFNAEFYSKRTGELWVGHNSGGKFGGEVLRRVQSVESGDHVIFRQISYKGPTADRAMFYSGNLIFRIE